MPLTFLRKLSNSQNPTTKWKYAFLQVGSAQNQVFPWRHLLNWTHSNFEFSSLWAVVSGEKPKFAPGGAGISLPICPRPEGDNSSVSRLQERWCVWTLSTEQRIEKGPRRPTQLHKPCWIFIGRKTFFSKKAAGPYHLQTFCQIFKNQMHLAINYLRVWKKGSHKYIQCKLIIGHKGLSTRRKNDRPTLLVNIDTKQNILPTKSSNGWKGQNSRKALIEKLIGKSVDDVCDMNV